MEGYVRQPEVTERLIERISTALRQRPELRLGQLLEVASENRNGYDLWNIHDEMWIDFLQKMVDE